MFVCCVVEFFDGVHFSFKVSWAWFRRFVAGVRVVSAKVPAFVTKLPGVRGVGSFLGLFRIWGWVSRSWLLVLPVWEGSLFVRV